MHMDFIENLLYSMAYSPYESHNRMMLFLTLFF